MSEPIVPAAIATARLADRRRVTRWRSIEARLMGATALLVTGVLVAIVALWVTSELRQVRRLTKQEARAFAAAMAAAWGNELTDQNWNQIRLQLQQVLERDPDYVYLLLSDDRQGGQIVAGAPVEQVGRRVPDLVPLAITRAALVHAETAREADTFLIRDVEYPPGRVRGRRGERVIEVAADVVFEGNRHGVLRVGVSLRRTQEASREIALEAGIAGAFCLMIGLWIASILARRLTQPVRVLDESAARMAAGDLDHRVGLERGDEIGALAKTFNSMAERLDESFTKLRGTLAAFERFVPRKFLHVVAPEGIENIQIGTRARRTVTILFCDIRGYTSLSESTTAEAMFLFLNEYLPEMGEAIEAHGGFIDKYIGDAIMALFDDDHTDGAIEAALAMRRSLFELNEKRIARGEVAIDIGIGIHRGEVVMGTVGFRSKMESTVIGDAVNLASRIEGLTKQYGEAILVSDEVVRALEHRERFRIRVVAEGVKVKGKGEPVTLSAIDDIETPRLSTVH